jgi:hypothetical protein
MIILTTAAVKTSLWHYQTQDKIIQFQVIKLHVEEFGFLSSVRLNPKNTRSMNPTVQHTFYQKKIMYMHKK